MIPNAHGNDLLLKGAHVVHMQKEVAIAACEVYVVSDFDTIEKALSSRERAEKGAKIGLPWSIADFRNPVFLYGIVAAGVSDGEQLTLQKRQRRNN